MSFTDIVIYLRTRVQHKWILLVEVFNTKFLSIFIADYRPQVNWLPA